MISVVHPEDLRDLAPRRSGNLLPQGANARSDEEAHVLVDVPVLEGTLVRLEPLAVGHTADLAAAADEERGSYGFTLVPPGSEIGAYLDAQFERTAQGLIPFAQVRQADGRAVGCTAYWDQRFWPGRDELRAIEIGFTWLSASAQGTGINAEAKLLLMVTPSTTCGCRESTSRPTPATCGHGGPSRRSARPSRACCAAGRCRGCRGRRGCCGTRRCTR